MKIPLPPRSTLFPYTTLFRSNITGSISIGGTAAGNVGDVAQKVGRTTGWTSGKITRTCANTSVSGSTVYLLCQDRKSTRLNSSHSQISYAVFCLKKKKTDNKK